MLRLTCQTFNPLFVWVQGINCPLRQLMIFSPPLDPQKTFTSMYEVDVFRFLQISLRQWLYICILLFVAKSVKPLCTGCSPGRKI